MLTPIAKAKAINMLNHQIQYLEQGTHIADGTMTVDEYVDSMAILILLRGLIDENTALKLLIDWVEDCDSFGYDNIPEEYERYKKDIEAQKMSYTEGLIYIALCEIKRKGSEEES